AAKAQSALQEIGLPQLLALEPNLTGAGVSVGQIEANFSQTGGNEFEVSPSTTGLPASLFTYIDQNGNATSIFNPAAESMHADLVADSLYVPGTGVATGVSHVDNYSEAYFTNNIIFFGQSIPDQVVNQSFTIGQSTNLPLEIADQEGSDTSYDNYIAQHGTIIVSGVGNSASPAPPSTCYNGIAVGASPGPSASGPTLDNGRSIPDITAPGDYTSFTTAMVSGAAAVLVQAGASGAGGTSPQTEAAAVDPRTIKALLLNGANKQSVTFNRTPTSPLDPVNGAGMLNIYNSYEQLAAGEFAPSSVASTPTLLSTAAPDTSSAPIKSFAGWSFNSLTSNALANAYANYVFQPAAGFTGYTFTATLDWERQYNSNPSVPLGINNLDLYLYDTTTNTLVDFSDSAVDNVQDVYDTNLTAGDRYDLEVLKNGGIPSVTPGVVSNSETYALAFNFVPGPAVVQATWDASGSGTWASATNWNVVPDAAMTTAGFLSSITAPATVTLNGNWTVGNINFNNNNSYTISPGSGGILTLDNGGPTATAYVTDSSGSHLIAAPIALNSSASILISSSASLLTLSGSISGAGGISLSGSGALVLSGANTYTGPTSVNGGVMVVESSASLPSTTALTIGNGTAPATFRLAANSGASAVSSLTVNPGATLDITNNSLAINYTGADPVAAIRSALAGGYSGGTWKGTGIASSYAADSPGLFSVGYADGSRDPGSPAQPNQILVKFTLAGDANLDGTVNFSDLLVVAQNFNRSVDASGNPVDWADGDFDYDGVVNFSDLLIVAQNFNKTLGSSELALLPSSFAADWQLADAEVNATRTSNVPDPGAIAAPLLLAGALLARRGRVSGRRISPAC
ncbi:MAG: autotransporter-associated beta strand repeat-containing protein, partial [Tepidisphaeraceae bacterium]